MRFSFPLYIVCLLVMSCGGTPTKPVTKVQRAPVASSLGNDGTTKLMSLITSYYGLKNALVTSDPAKAQTASKQVLGDAGNMSAFLQNDSVNKTVLQPFIDTVIAQCNQLISIDDHSCEKQRLAFGTLSAAMYSMLKKTGIKNSGAYKQYCPMAFNDKGAYWLSEEAEIKNPYFGKKMLECGEVQDSL